MDETVDQFQTAFRRHPDDIDFQRYVDEVEPLPPPVVELTLEDRVRRCFTANGFANVWLRINPDATMIEFRMERGQHAQFAILEEARINLRRVLRAAGFRLGGNDVVLEIEDGHWTGAFTPRPAQDQDAIDADWMFHHLGIVPQV